MKDIHHENINQFLGICFEITNASILMEYAVRGSLQDVLLDDRIKLTMDFKLSIAADIASGMKYLHSSEIGKYFFSFIV